jgi:hypothetical protein
LWVYTPFNEPLFTVKPSPKDTREKKNTPLGLLYLGGEFDEKKNFSINYDVVPNVPPPDPVTYGSGYNENYTKKRQLIYQGLQETIFNIAPKEAPNFVIVVIVATKSTIYLSDLKQYMTEAIPPDEYYLREQNEIFGDETLIGDVHGKFLKYEDEDWTDFLIDQIKTRVKFKFTQSDFPPDSDPDKTIAAIAANTLRFYPFTDYTGLYLYNIRAKKDMLYSKDQLKALEEKAWWEGKGKLTTIHFDAGTMKPPAADTATSSSTTTSSEQK